MSRPVKDARTGTAPSGPRIPRPKGKVGMPDKHTGRENPGAGGFVGPKPRPDWDGPGRVITQET